VSEATDADNCGACGHGCLGGACSGGLCQPITLTTFSGYGFSITLDTANVYFTNNTSLYSCPKTGCASPSVLTSAPNGTVLYAGSYLWVAGQQSAAGTWFFDQDESTGLTTFAVGTVQKAGGMTADTSNVYVGYGTGVMEVPLNNPGNERKLVSTAPGPVVPVVVDGANSYVYGGVAQDSGEIIGASTSESNGAFTTYISQQPNPSSMTITDGLVVWADLGTTTNNYQDGAVYMCATGAKCNVPQLVARGTSCSSLTADSTHVYFDCNGTLYRCSTAGCGAGPTPIASPGYLSGSNLTNDASALYWVGTFGTLVKLAK
jgi:hypothetical protein